MRKTFVTFLLLVCTVTASAQEPDSLKERRLQWFEDGKLGVLIHWGIYAVNGITESWGIFYNRISYEDYMKQLSGFTASKYDPEAWARLFKESGARYAVLTTKHHDGVALWDTKQNDLSVVKKTPAKRDLIGPYCDALRKEGLKVGLYFSHLDWRHPDYSHYAYARWSYDEREDTARWGRFLSFQRGQIRELAQSFRPDLFWFDGDWDYTPEKWKAKETREMIQDWLPRVIVNSRIGPYGDYDTPEGTVPITRPKSRYWELCMTTNDSWGYRGTNDTNWKSPNEVIKIFIDCISMGGNLLLDIGPREDGTIPAEQVHILQELGRWTRKHSEAIYGSRGGVPKDHFYGPSTISRDSTTLYLFLQSHPVGPVFIKGLKNKIQSVSVVGSGQPLLSRVKTGAGDFPGIVYIEVPREEYDKEVTVLAVRLDGPVRLHQ